MLSVLLTIHMIACVALVIAVMLQRSEGGALGMGGGGTGGVISGRGAASVLVKTTMGLAAVFFCTSIIMTRLNNEANAAPSTLEQQQQRQTPADPFAPVGSTPSTTAPATTPSNTAPAAPAPAPTVDPLAPSTAPAPATTTPPASTTPAPATTTPTAPAPTP
ncbi:MAG: preprotein translocase subunit SecG [Burkholderiales bacterium]|nr:MAG: preprotein translocase subunit SecG [Burkholderiales bacterium]